jgi:hypothetical protein
MIHVGKFLSSFSYLNLSLWHIFRLSIAAILSDVSAVTLLLISQNKS